MVHISIITWKDINGGLMEGGQAGDSEVTHLPVGQNLPEETPGLIETGKWALHGVCSSAIQQSLQTSRNVSTEQTWARMKDPDYTSTCRQIQNY